MGKDTLPCGHKVDSEGVVTVFSEDGSGAAYCSHHHERSKWRPGAWIKIVTKKPKATVEPSTQ